MKKQQKQTRITKKQVGGYTPLPADFYQPGSSSCIETASQAEQVLNKQCGPVAESAGWYVKGMSYLHSMVSQRGGGEMPADWFVEQQPAPTANCPGSREWSKCGCSRGCGCGCARGAPCRCTNGCGQWAGQQGGGPVGAPLTVTSPEFRPLRYNFNPADDVPALYRGPGGCGCCGMRP